MTVFTRIKLNLISGWSRFSRSTRLLLGASILNLRSRRGFDGLLIFIRLVGVFTIAVSLFMNRSLFADVGGLVLGVYLLFTLAILLFFLVKKDLPESKLYHLTCILVDTLAICFFIYHKHFLSSELYLLLLIPLITSAHFLPRGTATLFIVFPLLIYGAVIFTIHAVGGQDFTFADRLFAWSSHAFFLSISIWLYRVQRSIPSARETRVISPKTARERIVGMLESLKEIVPFDSISLQLIYHERLVIVACLGFSPYDDEVYRIEFPARDPNFPNHHVISSRQFFITDAKDHAVFSDPAYHVLKVRTWMGIPLISPSTGELLGMLSIDSQKENAYTAKDAHKAQWFAMRVSGFLIEAALGPAALTQATRREALEKIVEIWDEKLVQPTFEYSDDIVAAQRIVNISREVFKVEDCSMYLLRQKNAQDGEKAEQVLHLVASSAIPKAEFKKHESRVSGQSKSGLTGYSVFRKKTLNYGSSEVVNSPFFAGEFKSHLDYFATKHTKQLMVSPLLNHAHLPIGAIKLENKLGVTSQNRFPILEQRLFEIFAQMVGLYIEGIRQRNYTMRLRQSLHNMRGSYSEAVRRPLELLCNNPASFSADQLKQMEQVRRGTAYVATVIDNILFDPEDNLQLENAGLIPALGYFVTLLDAIPTYRGACEKIQFLPSTIRETLPYPARVAFFNIGREALLNSIRHAGIGENPQGKIEVEFSQEIFDGQPYFCLRIEDNGRGFNVEEKKAALDSFGLKDIARQEEILKGLCPTAKVELTAGTAGGTRLKVFWIE
jgi:hypothetical protein